MSAIVGGALGEEAGAQIQLLEEGWDQRAPDRLEHEGPHAGRQDGVRPAFGMAAGHHRDHHLRRRRRQHPIALDGNGIRAVLLLSFGGPEGPEQVRPFLENVTRGRNVPPERLDEVCRALPAFRWGIADQRHQPRADRLSCAGRRRTCRSISATATGSPTSKNLLQRCETTVFVVQRYSPRRRGAATPAARSMSRTSPGRGGRPGRSARVGQTAPLLRPSAFCRDVRRRHRGGRRHLARRAAADARLVFTAHSVPVAADQRCGPRALQPPSRLRRKAGRGGRGYADYDLAWQSRSGPPQVPWLEPDVADHLTTLAAAGTKAVIVCPSGLSPTTSRWCGISTTSCDHRPRRRASRSPGPPRPTPIGDSPGWPWV